MSKRAQRHGQVKEFKGPIPDGVWVLGLDIGSHSISANKSSSWDEGLCVVETVVLEASTGVRRGFGAPKHEDARGRWRSARGGSTPRGCGCLPEWQPS